MGKFFLTHLALEWKSYDLLVPNWTPQGLGLGHGQQGNEAEAATDLGRSI